MYVFIYTYMCMCVCVWISQSEEDSRGYSGGDLGQSWNEREEEENRLEVFVVPFKLSLNPSHYLNIFYVSF